MLRIKRVFLARLSDAARPLVAEYAPTALSARMTLEGPLHSSCTAKTSLHVVLRREACSA